MLNQPIGVAQYQLNELIRKLRDSGLPMQNLDAFHKEVTIPRGFGKLTAHFFCERFVESPDSHLRSFAGETVLAIVIIGLFLKVVVKPMEILEQHVTCFDLLSRIVTLLCSADDVIPQIQSLRELLHSHHCLFAMLYPKCMEPKIHFLKHAVDCLARAGSNLNCFSTERKHKDMFGTSASRLDSARKVRTHFTKRCPFISSLRFGLKHLVLKAGGTGPELFGWQL